MSEREMIVRHATRCAFCRALLAHSRRRQDRELLDAAEALASEHAENDGEHAAFAQRVRRTPRSVGAEHQDRDGHSAARTLARDVGGDENGPGRAFRSRGRR